MLLKMPPPLRADPPSLPRGEVVHGQPRQAMLRSPAPPGYAVLLFVPGKLQHDFLLGSPKKMQKYYRIPRFEPMLYKEFRYPLVVQVWLFHGPEISGEG